MKKKKYKKLGYQRNKYLEDIGLKPEECGTNFCTKKDDRNKKWKKQREKYGFDSRETWNLNDMFYEWLYSRLSMYIEVASKIVDLSYHTFEYTPTGESEPKIVTQGEAIEIIRAEAKRMILADILDSDYKPFDENIMILFYKILPALWW